MPKTILRRFIGAVARWVGLTFAAGLFAIAGPGEISHAAEVVVVCDDSLRGEMQPWVQFRVAEGLSIEFCRPAATARATKAAMAAIVDSSTRYVLLVGDVPTIQRPRRATDVPAFTAMSDATLAHGSTPTYPTDLPYGQWGDDATVTAAVGRLPVSDEAQLRSLIARILQYERSDDFGPWRRCVQLTGGVGGFGGMVDTAIESVTRTVLTSVLPADAKPQVAYASPGHPFCPTDAVFGRAVRDRYATGSRFWVYAGHARVDRLDILERSADDAAGLPIREQDDAPERNKPRERTGRGDWFVTSLLDNQTAGELSITPARAPVAVLLACYAGAIDAPGDCLAERMLLAQGGPVAVLAASRLTMPYGNTRLGLGLLEGVYQQPSRRLGDAVTFAVNAVTRADANPDAASTSAMVDAVAMLVSPAGTDLAVERTEHAGLYLLLGDPTLSLHQPAAMPMRVDRDESNDLVVSLTSPIAGTLSVCVDRPLGTFPADSPSASADDAAKADESDPHRRTIVRREQTVAAGQAVVMKLPVASLSSGPVVVRGFVRGASSWASGAVKTLLR